MHLPDICRVLSVLQVQILDILPHSWSRKCRLKNVQHSPHGFAVRSTPLFHRHSIFILRYLFYVHHHEKSSNHFTPVPEIIDAVFVKTSPKRSFSMTEYEHVGLVFTNTRVYKFGHSYSYSFYPSNHPRIMHKIMYIACKLFILVSGVVTRSDYLFYARLIWGVADLCWHDTYQWVCIHVCM